MTEQAPPVWAILLNYCSLEDTIHCVGAIRHIGYRNLQLLVLDNASPDGGGRQLHARVNPNQFVQLPNNTGYAGGNNFGIRAAMEAGAEYIMILNPDVRVGPDTVSTCVEAMTEDPSIGAINPIQVGADRCTIDPKFRKTVLRPIGIDATTYHENGFPHVVEVRDLLGAALFLSVRAIERVGGFDPLYFAYGEEMDLCRRLRYHGFRLAVTGRAPVRHLRTKESDGVSDRVLFLRLKGTYLEKLKNPWRAFRRSLQLVTVQFFRELLGKGRDEYPFNQYPVTRLHSIRCFLWVLIHLPRIRQHRRLEKAGRAHV